MNKLLSTVLEEQIELNLKDGLKAGFFLKTDEYTYTFRMSKWFKKCMNLNYEDFNLNDRFEYAIFSEILYYHYSHLRKFMLEDIPIQIDVRVPINYFIQAVIGNPNREISKDSVHITQPNNEIILL